jgi:aryl carrier-like protein
MLLTTAPDAESRATILQQIFIKKVAFVLGTPIESIAPSNPLSFYGLDSIVAVQSRKWFKETADFDLSLLDALSAKSIHALCDSLTAS